MEKYFLSLDYDGWSYSDISIEIQRIFSKIKEVKGYSIPISLYLSSGDSEKGGYHIRFEKTPMSLGLAFAILEYSECSEEYKKFCRKIEMFPIRVSKKIRRDSGGYSEKGEPVKIFELGNDSGYKNWDFSDRNDM